MSRPTAVLLAFIGLIVAPACDKVPLLAPNESTITLAVNTTTLGLNGTAELVASVIEPAGTPVHDGTTVVFTASVGVVEPREARTEGGVARATFRAGTQSGTASITAFSGSARSEPVEVLVGGAAAERITIRTAPASVPVSGGSVEVTAVVADASGNPLAGVPVAFSSDFGSLSANSVPTNATGEARTTLTTNRETVVKAAVAGKEATTTVRALVPPSITVTASADPTVGIPVTFTLSTGGGTGAARIVDSIIDFGDGTPLQRVGDLPPSPSTRVVTHVYNRAGPYTVTVAAIDQEGSVGETQIGINVRRVVPTISLTVSPSTPLVGQVVTVAVTITNPNNIRVQSLTVFFGNGQQAFLGSPQSGTHSASTVYTTPGTYTVRAELVDVNGEVADVRTQIVVRATL